MGQDGQLKRGCKLITHSHNLFKFRGLVKGPKATSISTAISAAPPPQELPCHLLHT